MATQMIHGDLGGGTWGFRVARPGYDAVSEPFGSRNISFDSRLANIGNVVAFGLAQCDGPAISFPAMNYVPVAAIFPLVGSAAVIGRGLLKIYTYKNSQQGANVNHFYAPTIGIVTASTIRVVSYTNPFYSTQSVYSSSGTWHAYCVYASE